MSEPLEPLLIGYILQSLSPSEHRLIEQQLEQQPDLRQQLIQWEEQLALIAYGEATEAAPASLKARILAAAAQDSPATRSGPRLPPSPDRNSDHRNSGHRNSGHRPRRRRRSVANLKGPWGVVAASLLICLGLGLHSYRLQQQLTTARINALESTHFLTLVPNTNTDQNNSSARVVIDELQGRVLFVAQQLQPLPEDEVYYLWATMEDSAIICGQVSATVGQTTIADLSIDPALYTSELVSMELVRGKRAQPPRSPQENIVLIAKV